MTVVRVYHELITNILVLNAEFKNAIKIAGVI